MARWPFSKVAPGAPKQNLYSAAPNQQWGKPSAILAVPGAASRGATGATQQSPVNAQQGGASKPKPSDARFRSFAERYVAARCHLFRVDPDGHGQDQWQCILDARRVYDMIKQVGRNIDPEEGAF